MADVIDTQASAVPPTRIPVLAGAAAVVVPPGLSQTVSQSSPATRAMPISGVTQNSNSSRDAFVAGRDLTINAPSRDVARLERLTTRAGADWIEGLRREHAVDALDGASVEVSAEVLKTLLRRNEDLVISLLADMRRGKVLALAAAIGPVAPWLEQLPDAEEAIARCGDGLGAVTRRLCRAARSQLGTEGYVQCYADGYVHWSARGGACVTRDEIRDYHNSHGGSGGPLGVPVAGEFELGELIGGPFGTTGKLQRFEGNREYRQEAWEPAGLRFAGAVYWSQYGAHGTWGSIGECYELAGGPGGWLGFPISDEILARHDSSGTDGCYQQFEGGNIYCAAGAKAFAAPELVVDYHEDHGGISGAMGFPVSPYLAAAKSPAPYQTSGWFQRFCWVWPYDASILDGWADVEGASGGTLYASDANDVYSVSGGIGILFEKLGGTSSWLGFPQSDETDARHSDHEPWCCFQDFEGGMIFWKEEYGAVAVSGSVMQLLDTDPDLREELGFPVAARHSLVSEDVDHRPDTAEQPQAAANEVQFFERGIVTIRNGVSEAWLRYRNPNIITGRRRDPDVITGLRRSNSR